MIEVIHTGPFQVNTYIVPLEGPYVFIVDPACCEFTQDQFAVSRHLESKGLIPVCIVLTHGHFDHVAGLKSLKAQYKDIPIFIHKADSMMIGASSGEVQSLGLFLMGFGEFVPSVSNLPEADAFFEEGKSLLDVMKESGKPFEGVCEASLESWKVIHTPGHTPGSICLYNEMEKLLLCGDTVFYHSWGRTDLPGGSEEKLMASLQKLYISIPSEVKVFPGHDFYGFSIKENL